MKSVRVFVLLVIGFPYAQAQVTTGTIIGPGVNNIDFSVLKNTGITERVTLQFRAEFFNLFNHTLFAEPDTSVDSKKH
jgi:hypothetical protein